jgi:hypothetical protein
MPFTKERFFGVFETYNLAVWPAQWALFLLGLITLLLVLQRPRSAGPWVGVFLSFLWSWMAVAYHLLRFAPVNPAAHLFGGLFLVQALAWTWYGWIKKGLVFTEPRGIRGVLGGAMILYALLLYPLLGNLLGHRYPSSPTFGLPCPTTLFTLGLLSWTDGKFPRVLLIVPLTWVLVGSTAAFYFGVYEDLGLLAAGAASLGSLGKGRKGP